MGFFDKLFSRSTRMMAEEFGVVLASLTVPRAHDYEAFNEVAPDEPNPLPIGVMLARFAIVHWTITRTSNPVFERLTEDRRWALVESYMEAVWHQMTAMFPDATEVCNKVAGVLGWILLPPEIAGEWYRRTGVHQVFSVVVRRVGDALDDFADADDEDGRSQKGVIAAETIGRVLYAAPDEDVPPGAVLFLAPIMFRALSESTAEMLRRWGTPVV